MRCCSLLTWMALGLTAACNVPLEHFERGDASDGPGQTVRFQMVPPRMVSGALSCNTGLPAPARQISVDPNGNLYVVMKCGAAGYVVVSTDGGMSFSEPVNLSAALPNQPVTVDHVVVASTGNGTAYVGFMLNGGPVFLRTTLDTGKTWSDPISIGASSAGEAGLSIQASGNHVYVGYQVETGVAVARNHNRGSGAFDVTLVAIPMKHFDLLSDAAGETLVVGAEDGALRTRVSKNAGSTFEAESVPVGQQYFSDWALGNGDLFVSGVAMGSMGESEKLYILPLLQPTSLRAVTGLPLVHSDYSRSVAADAAGNAFVASQLDPPTAASQIVLGPGAVRLDRLGAGKTAFDAPRTLSPTGTSPVVAPLPGNQGAAVAYTNGTSVYATVQVYP